MTKASNLEGPGGTDRPLILHLGHEELVIRQRYETISIVNDLLIGTWFLVGSFLFFSPSTAYAATWLFVFGSVEMLIRPTIRFVRRVHLRRYHPGVPGIGDGGHDF
ncbi:YrhK family protein [Paeniglutamicibacter antarcticus]|uniref:YrhK family protein n=1 Tax=Paeniglutamicibacter antarcticus TaxID=494023 RepID=A0ABP9TIU2_9MICC